MQVHEHSTSIIVMFDYDCDPSMIAKLIKIAFAFHKTTEVIFQLQKSSAKCQEDWNDETQNEVCTKGADGAVLKFRPLTK